VLEPDEADSPIRRNCESSKRRLALFREHSWTGPAETAIIGEHKANVSAASLLPKLQLAVGLGHGEPEIPAREAREHATVMRTLRTIDRK
jgi:hypothetical protein